MVTTWLGLGSNIGDRLGHIRMALEALKPCGSEWSIAPIYETAPREMESQPDFLNTVARCSTELKPAELLAAIHLIESKGGRDRAAVLPKGPRTIDVDILLYGEEIRTWDVDGIGPLSLPHKSMHERLFVLRPLLDLDPGLIDPRDGVPWESKASHLSEQRVKLYRI